MDVEIDTPEQMVRSLYQLMHECTHRMVTDKDRVVAWRYLADGLTSVLRNTPNAEWSAEVDKAINAYLKAQNYV